MLTEISKETIQSKELRFIDSTEFGGQLNGLYCLLFEDWDEGYFFVCAGSVWYKSDTDDFGIIQKDLNNLHSC